MGTQEKELELLNSIGGRLAQTAANDAAFTQALDKQLDVIETAMLSPVWLLFELRRMYSNDLDGFPEPDTKEEKGDENPDWYADGDTKRSVLNDFFDSLPQGRTCRHNLQAIRKAIAGKEAPAPFAGMERKELQTQRDRWRARQTSGRKMLRKALKVHFQELEFINELDDLWMNYWTVDGRLQVTSKPIVITDPNNEARFRTISINRFLQIDVWEIKEKGGKWEDLFEADEERTVQQPVVVPPVKNMVDVETRMKDIAKFLGGAWQADSLQRVESVRDSLLYCWTRVSETLEQHQPPAVALQKAA
jgi:hypothetical protein